MCGPHLSTDPHHKTISVAKINRQYFEIDTVIFVIPRFLSPSCYEKNLQQMSMTLKKALLSKQVGIKKNVFLTTAKQFCSNYTNIFHCVPLPKNE